MEKIFWLERWQQQQIGFHQSEINRYLLKYWQLIRQHSPDSQVFVPLCGKSRDMLWLKEQGHDVLGIEFSEMAVNDFFSENRLPVSQKTSAGFTTHQAENITMLCGDFFRLQATDLEHCQLVYDRASLVALPARMRKKYADHLNSMLPDSVNILLISMEYPQNEMEGPPFSVAETEVFQLFEGNFNIEKLETFDIYQENPRFREKGLSSLKEKVFHLGRNQNH